MKLLIPVVVGGSLVLAIIGLNWVTMNRSVPQWFDEARAAVQYALPGATVERMEFPVAPLDAPAERKPPYKEMTVICGYVDGRAFHYRVHERELNIGAPGSQCEVWYPR
jgi:hypothetical protein